MRAINYRDPIWALALVAALAFGLYTCEQGKNSKLEATAERSRVQQLEAELQAKINSSTARFDSLEKVRIQDSIKFASVVAPLKSSVAYWKKKALENRPEVDAQTDSLPVVREYIAFQDSIIGGQDSIISVQANHILAQNTLFQSEIGEMAEKHIQQQNLSELYKGEYVRQTKETARESRRKRGWRFVAAALGISTAVLALVATQ